MEGKKRKHTRKEIGRRRRQRGKKQKKIIKWGKSDRNKGVEVKKREAG